LPSPLSVFGRSSCSVIATCPATFSTRGGKLAVRPHAIGGLQVPPQHL
jgi:hypothetical protein